MRSVVLLTIATAITACSFARHARNSGLYPGAYDRTLENARKADNRELVAQIETLGESSDYNRATHELLWCLDGYAEGLAWQRKFEKDDIEMEYGGWASGMKQCVESCTKVAEGKTYEPSNKRDTRVATTYLPRCQASLADAQEAKDKRGERKQVARLEDLLKRAETQGTDGCFLKLQKTLASANSVIAELGDALPLDTREARVDGFREQHAEGLARAEAYERDPELGGLRADLRAIQTDERLVAHRLQEVDRAIMDTGPRTTYNAHGGQTGSSPGNSQAHERYKQERELLWRKRGELGERRRRIEAEFGPIAQRHEVVCR